MSKIDFKSLGLKPQYTFDDLVIGTANHIPARACLEVVKNPGDTYNPLLINGDSGTGKTHLVQAVAHAMLKADPSLKVKYISSERFANEVISAIAEDNVMAIRDQYSRLDLWILDDIQFLLESKSAQGEFFHIFNNLHQENRQILLTSDRSPNQLTGFDKTIRTRLEWGLVTEIKPHDGRARLEILSMKQKKYGLTLDKEMLRYAAGMLRSDVRELEGFLKKINAYVSLSHQEINNELIKQVIREILPDGQADVAPEQIPDEEEPKQQKPAARPSPPKPPPPEAEPNEQAMIQELEQVVNEVKIQNGIDPTPSAPNELKEAQPADKASAAPATPMTPKPPAPPKKPTTGASKPLEVVLPNKPKQKEPPKAPPPKPPEKAQIPTPKKKEEPKEPQRKLISPPADSVVPAKEKPPAPKKVVKKPIEPPTVKEEKKEDKKEEKEIKKEVKKAPIEPPPPVEEVPAPDLDGVEEDGELPSGHKEIGAVFFYPSGGDDALNTVHQKFQEVIKKHKLKFRLKKISHHAYEVKGKVNYTAFVDECKKSKVPVAIVIGPPPTAVIPEQDFYDLLSVTLDVQGISLQLVNWAEIHKDYRYLNLALDIALVRSR